MTQPAVNAPPPGRLLGSTQSQHLDVLRGLAAQLVLVHHACGYFLPRSGIEQLNLGGLGVLVFFLLSGFLITDSILARAAVRGFSFADFMISRFSRIFTAYVPAILLVAVVDHFIVGRPGYDYAADYNLPTGLGNLFMLQDFPIFQILRRLHVPEQWWFFREFGSGRQFWTVSVEWWIYVIAGLGALYVLGNRRPGPIMTGVLAVAAIAPAYHLIGGPGESLTVYWLTGSVACWLYRRWALSTPALTGRGVVLAWFIAAALAAARLLFTNLRIYDPVFAALLAVLLFLPLTICAGRARVWWTRLGIQHSAFHSYSLYLTHLTLLTWFAVEYGQRFMGWRGLVMALVGANIFAIAFAAVFEKPHKLVRRQLLAAWGRIQQKGAPAAPQLARR